MADAAVTANAVDYDIVVVGGGMAGACLAAALDGLGLRIALIEAQAWSTGDTHPGYDERTLALGWGSRRIFEGLGVWPDLLEAATPIRRIHISDRGHVGVARLDCRDEGVEALGYVVAARAIGAALQQRLAGLRDVDLLCPASVESVGPESTAVVLHVRTAGTTRALRARLVVAADGARSTLREQLGVPTLEWDYGQTAIIANVTPQYPHAGVAYERFTADGPLALLPHGERRCALVLTVASQAADAALAMDDAAFLALVQARFGERLGRFERVGHRQAHPLRLVKAREHARERVALVGNAAHTLHPIAGQGFNLGLRDVAALAEVIVDAVRAGADPGAPSVLARYADWRRWDQRKTIGFTDGLARLFTSPLPPLMLARNLGLLAFDLCAPAKRALARQMMGLAGRQPRLACGRPLTA
ncbi:2-octaprenyl-6-methoxyphenyl hydroxylase [Plasticicumulans acidivorans]|uniref:2-octaprenyl-6-methoxyphenol hydroxylase n=1 Tax=Plasticicumulans acidivorans TaxID=886464 RepID=A0A317MY69_9GAMM|nr:2-octaprenyl-6-methoxyphenyl hydroxylase [Plasticicumulans acidivorans]PWV64555.1 2-octaprenyl-6-methoxyphenol hydroxylase [Plasticicumulans acidivorans]